MEQFETWVSWYVPIRALFESGEGLFQIAISTVVNNPHKKSAPPKAHSAVPSVPPSDLPRVRRKDFDAYLRAVEPEWDRFQKNAELGRGAAAQVLPPSASTSAQALDFDFTPESPLTAKPSRSLPPLTSIPQVFFDRKFNLGDRRTFNAVSESESSASSSTLTALAPLSPVTPNDPSALAHSLPLLEKLSHHADTIEQHLVTEIARRARPFFAALSNLQDLQAESARCLARIQSLRCQLQDVDTHVAKRGLEAVRREARLERLDRVREGVKVVSGVVEMVGVARSLVGAGQWGEALSVVEELKAMWHAQQVQAVEIPTRPPPTPLPSVTEEPEAAAEPPPTPRRPPPSIPLSSLKAFANLPSQLQTLTLEIAASLTTDLVGVLKVDLTERIYGSPGGRDVDNVALRDRLRPLVHGLMRTSTVREAMSEWRNVALGEVKGVIKGHIPLFETEDDDSQARKTASEQPWIAHVRSMEHADFLALLRDVYRSFLNCIEGLQTSNLVLLDVVNGMRLVLRAQRIEELSSSDMNAVQDTLFDVLTSSAELANILSSKIFSARAEQHSKLQLQEFVELFNESWTFVVRCEVVCRRMIVGLRGVVIGQAKSFLQVFHQSRISQSAKLVEDEQWSQADVPPSLQHVANMLVDAAVHDPTEFILKSPASRRSSPSITTSFLGNSDATGLATRLPSQLPAFAFSSPTLPSTIIPAYFIVSATQEVLILVTDYLKIIVNLSLLTTDTMSRVIEFLKAFNSRMCQVVLGAGAMRSAGLKNITAKHLALASQSLSITIALIPYIRETFRRHLNPKQAVMLIEFDKLKRDYQEHQNEIHSKLIAIMGDRLTAHIKSLQQVKWDAPAAKPVNDYMELLVKETTTLHKVLSRYLSNTVVEYVMSQVFAAMNHRLSEEYTMIELPTPQAKERLLADARYLNTKFSALKNVTAPMGMLETVVSEKRVGPPGGATSPLPDPSSPRPAPTKRGSIFANDRIKGMGEGWPQVMWGSEHMMGQLEPHDRCDALMAEKKAERNGAICDMQGPALFWHRTRPLPPASASRQTPHTPHPRPRTRNGKDEDDTETETQRTKTRKPTNADLPPGMMPCWQDIFLPMVRDFLDAGDGATIPFIFRTSYKDNDGHMVYEDAFLSRVILQTLTAAHMQGVSEMPENSQRFEWPVGAVALATTAVERAWTRWLRPDPNAPDPQLEGRIKSRFSNGIWGNITDDYAEVIASFTDEKWVVIIKTVKQLLQPKRKVTNAPGKSAISAHRRGLKALANK
ncbi:hypothetical protein EWM64_g7359 [Hericium alpestre]|uniref:Vacuolar protein sorting-associated protein 54 C-terminal domain-containing protein n=1 Tax=Hericium alpestre TaxID=135208 RepID=A0A4Y9ZRJ2_9AGAM|nr:hypothetical protein EWM64_g7359 [Hericium alpestre]